MKESLSIDEIIRQAEEVRQKSVRQAQSANSGTSNNNVQVKRVEIPVRNENNNHEKSTEFDKTKISPPISENLEKTKHIEFKPKTQDKAVNEQKTVSRSFFSGKKNNEQVYSKEPPVLIERSATITTKPKHDKQSGLDEMPMIYAIDEIDNANFALTREEIMAKKEQQEEQRQEEEAVQIVLDGFDDETQKIDKIDEDLAEKQLIERRKDKVNKFRIFSPEDIEEAAKADKDTVVKKEYNLSNEQEVFSKKLSRSKQSSSLSVKITLVLTVLLGVLTGVKDSSYLPSLLLDDVPYIITTLVLFVAVLAVNIKIILHGFKLKNGINSDFPIALGEMVVLIHTVLLLFDSNLLIDDGLLYPFAGAFALFMATMGKYAFVTRIRSDYHFITNQKEKYTVEPIVNKVDAQIISKGLLMGEPNLKTSIKTENSSRFLDIASSDEPADKISKYIFYIGGALSVIISVIIAIINQNWHLGVNVFVCLFLISTPCYAMFCTNNTLLSLSKQLRIRGAMVNGFEGANVTKDANAIVIEAQDLFGNDCCSVYRMKSIYENKMEDCIKKTMAVVNKTKSPLVTAFNKQVCGKDHIMPEVEDAVYEDRLGVSAWIYKKKVLVGTRDLLIHHGVPVLTEKKEREYNQKGWKVLYFAEAGELMAFFLVNYYADPQLKKMLKKLEKSGMTILVKSNDPFINDESLAELFEVPDGYIRVMNASNGRTFEKYSNMYAETSPAYIVHNGSALGLISAVGGAENLQETRKLLAVLISFGCAIGLGVISLLVFLGGFEQLGAIKVVVFQLVWCIFVTLLAKLKTMSV